MSHLRLETKPLTFKETVSWKWSQLVLVHLLENRVRIFWKMSTLHQYDSTEGL